VSPSRIRMRFLLAVFLAGVFASALTAQDSEWRLVRADYGWRNQRNDVTNLLADLLARGGVNGRVAVNNQTMGGDPAVGKDKNLRVFAQNRRHEEREFDFAEGSFVDVRMFALPGRPDRDDWDDHDRDRGDLRGVQIIRAYYGVQGRTVNVTDLLRRMVRDGSLYFHVENGSLGGDPAVGRDKVLIVIYRFRGDEQATAVPEGGTLRLP